MERPNGAVDEKNLGIWRFTERINIGMVSLVGCDFNEVHGVTSYGANHNFGDNLWDLGSVWFNMSYSFPNLESEDGREGGWFVLLCCLGWKIDISWEKNCRVHGQLVCDTDIRGGLWAYSYVRLVSLQLRTAWAYSYVKRGISPTYSSWAYSDVNRGLTATYELRIARELTAT